MPARLIGADDEIAHRRPHIPGAMRRHVVELRAAWQQHDPEQPDAEPEQVSAVQLLENARR
jgi:hypothetical protein